MGVSLLPVDFYHVVSRSVHAARHFLLLSARTRADSLRFIPPNPINAIHAANKISAIHAANTVNNSEEKAGIATTREEAACAMKCLLTNKARAAKKQLDIALAVARLVIGNRSPQLQLVRKTENGDPRVLIPIEQRAKQTHRLVDSHIHFASRTKSANRSLHKLPVFPHQNRAIHPPLNRLRAELPQQKAKPLFIHRKPLQHVLVLSKKAALAEQLRGGTRVRAERQFLVEIFVQIHVELHVQRPFHPLARVQVPREIARPRELALAERADRRLLLGELVELEFHGVVGVAPGTQKVLDESELARIDAHAAGVVPHIALVALNEVPLHEGRLEAAAMQMTGRVVLDACEQIGHDGLHVLLDLPLLFENDLLHA